jgi:hypothetical protein
LWQWHDYMLHGSPELKQAVYLYHEERLRCRCYRREIDE